ncbi:MAG: hypothetical protein H6Q36_383 [Chloroflexi bacterium]|nr:hypothetical protein [Chloroflexota bacterium]
MPARPATPTTPARPAAGLTDEELARAEELEAAIMAEEREAATGRERRGRRRGTEDDVAPRSRSALSGSLAAVAADEYRYVSRDLRRIAIVFSALFAILLVIFALHVAGIVGNF